MPSNISIDTPEPASITSSASGAPRTRAQAKKYLHKLSSGASSNVAAERDTITTSALSTSESSAAPGSSEGPVSESSTIATSSASQSSERRRRQTRSASADEVIYGPQHLEHQFDLAYAELRSATIYAMYRLGYRNPRRGSSEETNPKPRLGDILARRFSDVERARRRFEEAGRKIQEALRRGQNWFNTPWPITRVVYDDNGMALDVVEVKEGEDYIDKDELEMDEIFAHLKKQNSALDCNSADGRASTMGTKRKHRGDADEAQREKRRRLDPEPPSSQGPSSSKVVDPSRGRRLGLRSTHVTQNP